MNRPIIGILGRIGKDVDKDEIIYVNKDVVKGILTSGGIPFLILPNNNWRMFLNNCDGLLIPGGYDFNDFDELVYKYALEKNMPILGICLGMQLMCKVDNEASNDFTILNNSKINHHQKSKKYVHKVYIKKNSKLYDIFKTNIINVNSRHNYVVPYVKKLRIIGYSSDNVIEAVEYENKKFVIGVQWHPESMIDYDIYAYKIFDYFIKMCYKYNR